MRPPGVPFDLGAPPNDLPEGTTGLPPAAITHNELPPVTSTPEAFVFGGGSEGPTAEQYAEIKMLPVDQQEFILSWWPHCWNRPSPYIGGKVVLSLAALQIHAEGYTKDQTKRKPGRKSKKVDKPAPTVLSNPALEAWEQDCAAREAWIEGWNIEWRRRVSARKEALAQWDSYVEEARSEFKRAKATERPVRPA